MALNKHSQPRPDPGYQNHLHQGAVLGRILGQGVGLVITTRVLCGWGFVSWLAGESFVTKILLSSALPHKHTCPLSVVTSYSVVT